MRRLPTVGIAIGIALVAALAAAQPLAKKLDSIDVWIKGERFVLEVARDPQTQFRGLGGRTHIDANGGMIFPFPEPRITAFVMRDCPIPIDIAFLDAAGRVITTYEMQAEPPRKEGESPMAYEARLKRYPSGLPASFAIETAGGRLRALGLRPGDTLDLRQLGSGSGT
jgi:uncharacterized membrane protein (UPF0127 family)